MILPQAEKVMVVSIRRRDENITGQAGFEPWWLESAMRA